MMKQITQPIKDFVLAFDLINPLESICFEANVFFYTDSLQLQFESEIHIITILAQKIDVLYILNPAIRNSGFPDMFESAHNEFDYRKKKGLIIRSADNEEIFSVLIQPTGKDCKPATLEEIITKVKS